MHESSWCATHHDSHSYTGQSLESVRLVNCVKWRVFGINLFMRFLVFIGLDRFSQYENVLFHTKDKTQHDFILGPVILDSKVSLILLLLSLLL